jgi:ribonuclease HII
MGPLVIAGAAVSDEGAQRLEDLQIKDSKIYKNAKTVVNRFMEIGSIVDKFTVRLIDAQELIENNANKITLDMTMIPYIVEIVKELAAGLPEEPEIHIDNIQHKEQLEALLRNEGFKANIEPAAEKYIAVAAASVVASAQFELEMRKLRVKYGDLGSGNPNDPKTINWLKTWWKSHKSWPDFVRIYYKTIKRMMVK